MLTTQPWKKFSHFVVQFNGQMRWVYIRIQPIGQYIIVTFTLLENKVDPNSQKRCKITGTTICSHYHQVVYHYMV